MVGTLLGPPLPVVGVGTTYSDRKRRHPDFPPDKKTAERNTLPAYPGLRAVYTPAITPVVGSRSTAPGASWRAMLNETASDESMFTLEETPRVGQHALRRITGEHDQVLMGLLAGAFGLLLLGKIIHKVPKQIPCTIIYQSSYTYFFILHGEFMLHLIFRFSEGSVLGKAAAKPHSRRTALS